MFQWHTDDLPISLSTKKLSRACKNDHYGFSRSHALLFTTHHWSSSRASDDYLVKDITQRLGQSNTSHLVIPCQSSYHTIESSPPPSTCHRLQSQPTSSGGTSRLQRTTSGILTQAPHQPNTSPQDQPGRLA